MNQFIVPGKLPGPRQPSEHQHTLPEPELLSCSPLELRHEDLKVHNVLPGSGSIQGGAVVFRMGAEEGG